MRILKVYDRTLSLRATAQECGCSHHTVASYVQKRALGQLGEPVRRPRLALIDPHRPLIEELVQQSRGRIRADKCHQRLLKLGYTGSERTTRRAVAKAKQAYKKQNRRVFRPWITEPGKWAQWDWAKGPPVNGQASWLFCAWLSWSRYRVVLPTRDRKLETLVGCLTETQSWFGGVPCNWLTDNERTVSTQFVASIAVRHPLMVGFGRFHGCAIATCQVADPATKGGSEATVWTSPSLRYIERFRLLYFPPPFAGTRVRIRRGSCSPARSGAGAGCRTPRCTRTPPSGPGPWSGTRPRRSART